MIKLSLFSWLMFPVYAWQGIQLRRRIERLHPAPVSHRGIVGAATPDYKLLIIGDSTVEGLSLTRVEDIFAHSIAVALNGRTGKTVFWRRAGANSATSAEIRDNIVPHVEERDFTHIVIAVGTNDTKNFHTTRRFSKAFGTLLYALRARFPDAQIIWTPVADMTKFPALPKQLSEVLAARAALINHTGKILCEERGAIYSEPIPIDGPEGFAHDGFHAGPLGNQIWGEHITDYILAEEPDNIVSVAATTDERVA